MRPFLNALATLLLLTGCATPPAPVRQRPVTHVVVCWLKQPGNPADRARLLAGGRDLERIPGVRRVQSGEALPSRRPGVAPDYDAAFVIEFEDERALRAYENHPTHLRAVREVLIPLVARYQVYDFVPSR